MHFIPFHWYACLDTTAVAQVLDLDWALALALALVIMATTTQLPWALAQELDQAWDLVVASPHPTIKQD